MIHGIRLVNFGNHRDLRLEFNAMTALVGRNGAGKTTVLRGIRELARSLEPTPPPVDLLPPVEFTIPTSFIRSEETNFGLSISGTNDAASAWGYALEGNSIKKEGSRTVTKSWQLLEKSPPERLKSWVPSIGPEKFLSDTEISEKFAKTRAELVLTKSELSLGSNRDGIISLKQGKDDWINALLDHQYLHSVGQQLHKPSYTTESIPKITSQGGNLPSTIAYLMTSERELFDELSDSFRKLIPIVRQIRVRPALVMKSEKKIISVNRKEVSFDEEREFSGHELIFDLVSGKSIPAEVVSEGTLLSLALLTVFYTTHSPNLFLIDDTEQALHPQAQRDLIRHLKSLQSMRPNLQIILTTHSPYIIDEMNPEDVWVLDQDRQGETFAKRLSKHPDLERAKGVLTTGEFWSAEGEDWVQETNLVAATKA